MIAKPVSPELCAQHIRTKKEYFFAFSLLNLQVKHAHTMEVSVVVIVIFLLVFFMKFYFGLACFEKQTTAHLCIFSYCFYCHIVVIILVVIIGIIIGIIIVDKRIVVRNL